MPGGLECPTGLIPASPFPSVLFEECCRVYKKFHLHYLNCTEKFYFCFHNAVSLHCPSPLGTLCCLPGAPSQMTDYGSSNGCQGPSGVTSPRLSPLGQHLPGISSCPCSAEVTVLTLNVVLVCLFQPRDPVSAEKR